MNVPAARTVLLAGASGLIGRALQRSLRAQGCAVRRLVRGGGAGRVDEIPWDPAAGKLDPAALRGVDAVINLAGENIGRRWTAARRAAILHSRVNATRSLVAALGAAPVHPAVFLSASALGYYGDRGDEVLTETSAPGRGFLADVCRAWETEAQAAARHGVRTVLLRFGTVLAREGGALAKMLPVFRLGLGGRFGAGRQWMSWIALADVTGAVLHCLRDARCVGPINFAAPAPAINADFTAALGRVLRRPAFLPVPASALRLAFAGMADEALLASTRAKPGRLLETGYVFQQPQLEGALRAALR